MQGLGLCKLSHKFRHFPALSACFPDFALGGVRQQEARHGGRFVEDSCHPASSSGISTHSPILAKTRARMAAIIGVGPKAPRLPM